jgi:hypothetical protein
MTTSFVSRSAQRAGILFSLLALAACNERGAPLAPETTPEQPALEVAQIKCTASVKSLSVSCGHPDLGGARGLVVGGQNVYVKLTSSNLAYDSGTGVFAFDVTVQNLIPQAMATTDGATGTANGVRVFFMQQPVVTAGSGSIAISNPDGTEAYTSGSDPYYQYAGTDLGADGILATSETSGAKNWILDVPSTVETFSFFLMVATDVQFPDGWVEVSPAADTMVAGATQGLTAVVKSAVGNTLSETVSWGTSDAAIATVDAGGTVTGVAPGAATITATAGSRTGEASLAICPDLAVGGVYTAVMPGAASLCFAGGASGNAEYTYSPINFSSSTALSLTLTGAGIVPVSGPPSPNVIAGNGPRLSMAVTSDDDRHLATMERERRELEPVLRNPASRIERARRGGRDGARFLITPGVPAVGDVWSLNVAQGCTGTPEFRGARVMSVGTHVVVVADTTNPAGGFTSAQYDSIAAEFDSLAYATDTVNFGGPTDLDDNERVVAFYTRAVNQLSPPASSSVVTGYFTARDLFSSGPTSCTLSNEGEIFYMLVPDPTGAVNSNVRTVASVRSGTVATMAHELQHLINASRRVYVHGTQTFEQVWLNEGLSHIAEELVFYRITGLAPRSNVSLSTITASSARINAYNTYMSQNFGRYRAHLSRPDTAGPIKNSDALAVRGAIFSFLRYAADRRNDDDAALWYTLVNTTLTGTANLQNALGSTPNDWVRDWIATIYGDDAGIGIGTQYQITSWNFRSVYSGLGGYPLQVRPLANNTALTVSYSRGGGSAMGRFGVPTGSFAGVTALSGGNVPATPYALIVTRTK